MKNKLIEVFIFVIFLALLFCPTVVHSELISALEVFFKTLFPSIFPFFLIGNLLISYNFVNTLNRLFQNITTKVFHTNSNATFVILMSMVSGFPSGAKYIRDLLAKKIISEKQANYLITFTHFANPLFVLTITSSIFKDIKISYFILLSMYLSNLIIGIITRPKKIDDNSSPIINREIPSFSSALTESLTNATNILVMILGNTCFFYLVSRLVTDFLPVNLFFEVLINGFFDLTKGISSLSFLTVSPLLKGMLILTFICFGGINIHMQVLNMLNNTNVKYHHFLLGRIAQSSIATLLFYLFFNLYT